MTTEDESLQELPQRSLDVLLALDTYQGMTDAEIDSLIEYKCSKAAMDAVTDELNASFAAVADDVAARSAANEAMLYDMVERVLERSTNIELGVIGYE